MKTSTKIKAALAFTTFACAIGAAAATTIILLQKKREEEVYHEAELKAMDELEEMMRENPMESDADKPEETIEVTKTEADEADDSKSEAQEKESPEEKNEAKE